MWLYYEREFYHDDYKSKYGWAVLRIRIRIKVKSWIRNGTASKSKRRIRIHINVKGRIRIRNKWKNGSGSASRWCRSVIKAADLDWPDVATRQRPQSSVPSLGWWRAPWTRGGSGSRGWSGWWCSPAPPPHLSAPEVSLSSVTDRLTFWYLRRTSD